MRLLALLALGLFLLPGCTTDEDVSDAQKLLDQAKLATGQGTEDVQFTMNVTAAAIVPGRCFDGATSFGDECHLLDVTLNLTKAKRDLDLWHGWRGFTQAGLGIPSFAEGGQVAAAGRIVQVQMRFEMDAGTAERLVELQHKGDWGPTYTTAAVPAY
ncbi:MAG: hypothetical protein QOD77_964 [Thermoplasmata archaeon]|nr:hypothetical protein [Thermoplasmata archaeon]